MVKIRQDFVSDSIAKKVTYGGVNGRKWITVHQTGNVNKGANAEMHARLQKNGNSRAASWPYQVDDKEAVQSFPHTAQCFHAGDGRGNGNLNSIGVELCINSDGNYSQTLKNRSELIAQIMKQENIPLSRVVQHNHWSGKNCPAQIRAGKDGVNWEKFLAMVKAAYDGVGTPVMDKPTPKPQPAAKTIEQLAQEVIAGKHGTGDARKQALGSQFSAVQARVNEILGGKSSTPKPAKKSSAVIAQEVLDGKWGTNPKRKADLEKAGYNYTEVQGIVNRLAGAKPKKSIDQMAREVIAGKHGQGHANRQKSLGISAAEYQKVRARVNQLA